MDNVSQYAPLSWPATTMEQYHRRGCQTKRSCHSKRRSDTDFFFMYEGSLQTYSALTNCNKACRVAVSDVARSTFLWFLTETSSATAFSCISFKSITQSGLIKMNTLPFWLRFQLAWGKPLIALMVEWQLTVVPKGSDTWVSRGVCLLLPYCSDDPDGAGL